MSKRLISFDTETTGLDFNTGDRVVEIGAVEIKVINGTDNEESKKGLIKGYAESNFGNLDMESELWNGYKIWDIGSKQIYYYAYESKNQPTDEGIVVTSKKYYDVLLHDNYE